MSNEDRDRFVHQARCEGMSLSAWLRTAARERLDRQQRSDAFESPSDLERFFRACDALEGPKMEPEWGEHLDVIDESRRRGVREIKSFDPAFRAVAGRPPPREKA